MHGSANQEIIKLPEPGLDSAISVEKALAARRSVRYFAALPLTLTELSQILWAAQGLSGPSGLRTTPSAGALYPLELYLATSSGLYHYVPGKHELRQRDGADLRRSLYRAALAQDAMFY